MHNFEPKVAGAHIPDQIRGVYKVVYGKSNVHAYVVSLHMTIVIFHTLAFK